MKILHAADRKTRMAFWRVKILPQQFAKV